MPEVGAAVLDGDPLIGAELERLRGRGRGEVAAAVVDLESDPVLRVGFSGRADSHRGFEIGSVTKGLTGLLVADAIERGELTLDTRVEEVLGAESGTSFGSVSVRELVTHTSGLPRLGWGIAGLAALTPLMLAGLDPYRGIGVDAVLAQAGAVTLSGRGAYRYSNLGGAVAGQLVARRAGATYAELLSTRLFEPLGMTDSSVSRRGHTARWGHSGGGLPRAPWILGGYSPAGGVISTATDMGILLRALLDGSAPGMGALERIPDVAGESPARASATFWVVQVRSRRLVPPFIWHNGGTGGYSSFVLLSPAAGRAVAVLANVSRAETPQEIAFALFDGAD